MSAWGFFFLVMLILILFQFLVILYLWNNPPESSNKTITEKSSEEDEKKGWRSGFESLLEGFKQLNQAVNHPTSDTPKHVAPSKGNAPLYPSSGGYYDVRDPILPHGFVNYKEEVQKNDFKTYQDLTQRIAEEVFGVPFKKNVRPPWMKIDGKSKPLELDMISTVPVGPTQQYIAIEYNGEQHYRFPNYFHKNNEEGYAKYLRQCQYDDLKPDLCNKQNVYLITVPYTIHRRGQKAVEDIRKWLLYYSPENQLKLMHQARAEQEPNETSASKEGFILKTPTVRGFPVGPPGMRELEDLRFSFASRRPPVFEGTMMGKVSNNNMYHGIIGVV